MMGSRLKRRWIVPAFLLAVGLLAGGVWRYGYLHALDQLARRAEVDLALASDRLSSQLQVYQELAVLLSDHPVLSRLETDRERRAARDLLLEMADKTAAMNVVFAAPDGAVLAAAKADGRANIADAPDFRRAMHGALGSDHGVRGPAGRRAYSYAAPVFAPSGGVRGALVVTADVEDVEETWRGSNPAVFFVDQRGEVFITNRSELLFWRRMPGQDGLVSADGQRRDFSTRQVGSHVVWQMNWGRYLPKRGLVVTRDLPVIGLSAVVLADVAPARRLAALQASTVAALCLAFGALLFLATERRRTLAEANAELETRVSDRTRALSEANTQLRREVAERLEAEAALRKAQADLVQAGKLTALGQMSAGISHELNQPLMAIRSFAENGGQFLERGRTDVAADNLARISDLARRMGRIIRNLRAFARQESEAAGRVDVVAVLDSVIELTEARLRHDGVTLEYDRPDHPVWVRGGEVRLGQVFVNLVTNAADAMNGSEDRQLEIDVAGGDAPMVTVRDTGPGIDMPDKMFDPFYSTKEVGASEGMGLGLSISYGIVQSFGGDIRGENAADGGAVFTVQLEPWREEQAA